MIIKYPTVEDMIANIEKIVPAPNNKFIALLISATRSNYWKFLKQEDRLQVLCSNYLKAYLPEVFFTHPMNEGKRSPFESYKVLHFGMSRGISDILVFNPASGYNGFAIELKAIYKAKPLKKGNLSGYQKDNLEKFREMNWETRVMYTLEEFIFYINSYLNN